MGASGLRQHKEVWVEFTVVMTSPTAGHLQTGGNSINSGSPVTHANGTIPVPAGMVTVVSLPAFALVANNPGDVWLFKKLPDGSDVVIWPLTDWLTPDAAILRAKSITVRWNRHKVECYQSVCFKLNFSFHPENRSPQILPNGKWNCSVDEYSAFKHHLECNLMEECHDGRDEAGHCAFSSPACEGLVASRHKCFQFVPRVVSSVAMFHAKSQAHCRSLNGTLAVLNSEQDFNIALPVISKLRGFYIHVVAVGMFYGGTSVPDLYRHIVLGVDNSALHHVRKAFVKHEGRGKKYVCIRKTNVFTSSCLDGVSLSPISTVCEFERKDSQSNLTKPRAVRFPPADFDLHTSKQDLVSCPSGWFTHKFLTCQPHAVCGAPPPSSCNLPTNEVNEAGGLTTVRARHSSVASFVCSGGDDDGDQDGSDDHKVSYTVLCDFRKDCPDNSDESFCEYSCDDLFKCYNRQCLPGKIMCDYRSDCIDGSDELFCSYEGDKSEKTDLSPFIPSPILVKFDGHSSLHAVQMKPEDSCPDTHYRCPGEYNDCLPVYTRCNGYGDCMDHEDEEGCGEMTCPGFYHCLTSTVCVHVEHLCDGWPQCPQRDDEWLCDVICPADCLCVGLSFLCLQPFPAHLFPQLRYVDARNTGMSLSELTHNLYIVYLNLAQCSMAILKPMDLPNLQHLDLSGNLLHNVSMDVFVGLKNLHSLILANNPIVFIHRNHSSFKQQNALNNIDLSHTKLTIFDSNTLSFFHKVTKLNISFTTIHTIKSNGFRHLKQLVQLYMEGSPVKVFPADMFAQLSHLQVVTAQTYKVCCRDILQELFEKTKCDAPVDDISSCDDLLQSGAYRGFLWLVSALSVLGNVFCFVVRACTQKKSTTGFHVFVTNLSVSDFLMGVYIAVIGVADAQLRGRYLIDDHVWTSSVACKAAGFLSLLSSEVSALIIWLITLDRFIVLRFPFSSLRFGRTSAVLICCLTWSLGFVLALIPLLPVTSSWEFYSQTGICIPLPVTRRDFKGRMYSFSVLIVLNFILFLLIATGQAIIYWSVQKNAMATESTKVSQDMTIARRLISVAVTDFLCWFPIGLCGLMALAGIPIPGEVNTALAIFVLPLNSALNPFMYTFNMLVEKRRKSNEERLIKWLELKLQLLSE